MLDVRKTFLFDTLTSKCLSYSEERKKKIRRKEEEKKKKVRRREEEGKKNGRSSE